MFSFRRYSILYAAAARGKGMVFRVDLAPLCQGEGVSSADSVQVSAACGEHDVAMHAALHVFATKRQTIMEQVFLVKT